MSQQFSHQPFRHYEQNVLLVAGIVYFTPAPEPTQIAYGNSGYEISYDNVADCWLISLTDDYPFRESLTTTNAPDDLTCVSKGYADSFVCVAQNIGIFEGLEIKRATVASTPFLLNNKITFQVCTYRANVPVKERKSFSFRIYATGINNRVVRLPNGDIYG